MSAAISSGMPLVVTLDPALQGMPLIYAVGLFSNCPFPSFLSSLNFATLLYASSASYTPAYTLRGIFMQLLCLFSAKSVPQDYDFRAPQEHLGSAMVVQYRSEGEIVKSFVEAGLSESRPFQSSYVDTQRTLERVWLADRSEEVMIFTYENNDSCKVKQSTKRNMQAQPDAHKRVFKFESRNPLWEQTYRKIRTFECPECGYGSLKNPHSRDSLREDREQLLGGTTVVVEPYLVPPPRCRLSRICQKLDILHELCDYMSDETVRAFKAAYPPLCSFLERTQLLEKRQLRCFFLGTPIDECTLGIGINYDSRTQTLSSGLDLLSEEAFVKFGVRRSIRKQEFSFFLPLALTKPHFARAKPRIYECLKTLNAEVALHERRRVVTPVLSTNPLPSRATSVASHVVTRSAASVTISRPGAASPGVRSSTSDLESINVLFKLMNDLIKQYTRTAESILDAPSWSQRESLELTTENVQSLIGAAERSMPGYWTLMHLLVQLCKDDPNIAREARHRVKDFINNENRRNKHYEPDLGELLIVASLVFICQDEKILTTANTRPQPLPVVNAPPQAQASTSSTPQTQATSTIQPRHRYALRHQGSQAQVAPLTRTHPYPTHRRVTRATSAAPPPITVPQAVAASVAAQSRAMRGSSPAQPDTQLPPKCITPAAAATSQESDLIRWKDHFAGPFLQEALTRCVPAVLDSCPDLQFLEAPAPGGSIYRLSKTFQHSRLTFRLLAFQVSLIAVFSHFETTPLTALDSPLSRHFGRPPDRALLVVTEEIKSVFRMSNWRDFFAKCQYDKGRNWSDEELSAALRECVKESERKGYHENRTKAGDPARRLAQVREKKEKDWKRDNARRMRGLRG
jgi:hypothetical protein